MVGIAGLAGAGRTEVVESIFGAQRASSGEIELNGRQFSSTSPSQSVNNGLGLLTEDRKRTGLCLNLPLSTNITLANVDALLKSGRLQLKVELKTASGFIQKLNIKPPFPAVEGAWRCPTVVNNASTIASLPSLVQMGVDEFTKIEIGRAHV